MTSIAAESSLPCSAPSNCSNQTERDRIRGFCINKFRGDLSLLEPGLRMMEERLGKPCLGVVPYLPALALEEEDSVGLPPVARAGWATKAEHRSIVRCASQSSRCHRSPTSLTSTHCARNHLSICTSAVQPSFLANADIVILPGSKQTMSDLEWMRAQRFDRAVNLPREDWPGGRYLRRYADAGPRNWLIPSGIERQGRCRALACCPSAPTMQADKVTRLCSGVNPGSLFGQPVTEDRVAGYEIHIGKTLYQDHAEPFATLIGGEPDGCISADRSVLGTYLHGIFDHDGFRHQFLIAARSFYQLAPPSALNPWTSSAKNLSTGSLAR